MSSPRFLFGDHLLQLDPTARRRGCRPFPRGRLCRRADDSSRCAHMVPPWMWNTAFLVCGKPRSGMRSSYAVAAPAVTGPVPPLGEDNMSYVGRSFNKRENGAARGTALSRVGV